MTNTNYWVPRLFLVGLSFEWFYSNNTKVVIEQYFKFSLDCFNQDI